MHKVLTICYTQTGQLAAIKNSVCTPLEESDQISLETLVLEPEKPFPFPWPFFKFFRIFPETVKMQPIDLKAFTTKHEKYDLIILTYQVWFLSPSLPIASFLQSEQAKALFADTPVVTIIGCRGMWLMAQEKVKTLLKGLNAKLVDNVVLSDDCGAFFSFLATPLWMLTGKRKPLSWVPAAGIAQQEITSAKRFGEAIKHRLETNPEPIQQSMFGNMSAVTINEKLIASERMANHSFGIWSNILQKIGPQDSTRRAIGLCVYVTFLILLILTVVPISALLKKLISPLTKSKIIAQKKYYAEPSGE
ncbi:dialkylresorcinol condensing enzyme [Paraglaciecola aquimarina]|uniref:Dialkylresorcinol condensing enzyme n=1 Tax=Paraglaciecola aquimarina TaxID=1235557 RepID=A0ABU3SSP7_9ALTE|nr:dialkylrecorsinol condensing enzyme [Paraglaciecola aquimarina]MDU0353042.1 dialkylresorcinol condensing enzyme [Paraglaciecola aquimarina]